MRAPSPRTCSLTVGKQIFPSLPDVLQGPVSENMLGQAGERNQAEIARRIGYHRANKSYLDVGRKAGSGHLVRPMRS
jgi:hypothetical protein